MDFDEYQKIAIQSIAITNKDAMALAHRSFGLFGKSGIIGNDIKKIIRDKNGEFSEEDIAILKENLGDVLFYLSALAEYTGLELSDIAKDNLKKSAKFKDNHR